MCVTTVIEKTANLIIRGKTKNHVLKTYGDKLFKDLLTNKIFSKANLMQPFSFLFHKTEFLQKYLICNEDNHTLMCKLLN